MWGKLKILWRNQCKCEYINEYTKNVTQYDYCPVDGNIITFQN